MKDKSLLLKRIFTIVSLVIAITVFVWLGLFLWNALMGDVKSAADFTAHIKSFGWKSYLVALGIQMLQVFIAFIPGEVVEIGTGLAFGWFKGMVLCLIGVAIASSFVFLLTKLFGVKLVELFVDRGKIDNLKFLNSEKKLKRTIFFLFFLPGTPKDLITYFVGLTRIKLSEFLIISTIARIPSVASSTLGGHYIINGEYIKSIAVFAATGIVSLIGMYIYSKVISSKQNK